MKNPLIKDALVLTLITLVAGVALGLVYEITKEPIAIAEAAAVAAAYQEVFEDAAAFEDVDGFDTEEASAYVQNAGYPDDDIDSCVRAVDASGNPLGYVITVTSHAGYGGDITFSVGITDEGTVNGYSITSISETAGLGMKAKEEKFSSQFKSIPVGVYEVTKSTAGANEIEAISGATITSWAMTYGVDAAITYFNSIAGGGQ